MDGMSSMVRFAMNTYGRFTVNYCARNLDNFLVGWRFNAQALGFYKKAYDLFALSAGQVTSPLSNVAVSVLSRLRHDAPKYKGYLLSSVSLIAFVGMGLSGYLTLVGKDVILILLGPRWGPAGRIFVFFGPGIGGMLVYEMHGWIHLSIGRADRWFRWGIVEFAVTGLLFVLGLRWGPAGVAVAWTASFWILLIPAFWYAANPIRLEIRPIFAVIWKYALASLLAGCVSVAIMRELPYSGGSVALGAIIHAIEVAGVFGVLYVVAVVLTFQSVAPLFLVGKIAQELTPWGRHSRLSPAVAAVAPPAIVTFAYASTLRSNDAVNTDISARRH
jgi:O-antigen/teichoic acid export membrane protein